MKKILLALFVSVSLLSCSTDDLNTTPIPVQDAVVIQTATATVTTTGGNLEYVKLNGEFISFTDDRYVTFTMRTYDVLEVKLTNCPEFPNPNRGIRLQLGSQGVWSCVCEGTFLFRTNQAVMN